MWYQTLFVRLFAIVVSAGLLYSLSIYAVSDINSEAVISDYEMPLANLQHHADVLSAEALVVQSISKTDSFEEAEQLALNALQNNLSSGRAASRLLELYEKQGSDSKADEVAELSGRLWSAHTFTRSRLADYWFSRGRVDKVVEEWNVLLIRNPRLRSQLFPYLMNLINDPSADALMGQFVQSPPNWWPSFFAYLSRELSIDRLREVYQARVLSSVRGVSDSERGAYVSRLVKEGEWQEARDAWSGGLKPYQKKYDNLIFDGGFESGIYNQAFGWVVSRSKNPRIKPDITYGIKGRKALQVSLRKNVPINFRHVSQRLMLEPGYYELALRYRTDTLKTTKGLSWRIRCIEGGSEVLVESIPLLGSNPWSKLSVDFEVPESCRVQLIRLEATSRFRHEQYFAGSLWFDDIEITRKQEEE